MSLKTELQAAIAHCNTALNGKGAESASTVYEIGDKIDTIETSGEIDDLTLIVTPYVKKLTGLLSGSNSADTQDKTFILDLLKDTKYKPIDIHTPLWLWSRNGFKELHK